jgi:hypothetical protein
MMVVFSVRIDRRDLNPKLNVVQPLTDVNPQDRDRSSDAILLVVESFNN